MVSYKKDIAKIKSLCERFGWEVDIEYESNIRDIDRIVVHRIRPDGKTVYSHFFGNHGIGATLSYLHNFLPEEEQPPKFAPIGSLLDESKRKREALEANEKDEKRQKKKYKSQGRMF